jgi:hypothetical protein
MRWGEKNGDGPWPNSKGEPGKLGRTGVLKPPRWRFAALGLSGARWRRIPMSEPRTTGKSLTFPERRNAADFIDLITCTKRFA